jgi:solute carrier family 25 protein 16
MSEIAQHSDQPRQAGDALRVDGVVVEGRRTGRQEPAICPTDGEAVVPRKKLEKRSFDYLWRSAVAGGLAGCAVSSPLSPPARTVLTPTRQRQLSRP